MCSSYLGVCLGPRHARCASLTHSITTATAGNITGHLIPATRHPECTPALYSVVLSLNSDVPVRQALFINSVLQMEKLRHREVKPLAQGHAASQQLGWDVNPSLSDSKTHDVKHYSLRSQVLLRGS